MDQPLESDATAIAIAIGAAVLTVAAIRLRAWMRGLRHELAPLPREFISYLLAFLVSFWAMKSLGGYWPYLVMVGSFTLALAVTVHGPAPLNRDYLRTAGFTFLVLLGCLLIGAALGPCLPD